MTKAIGVSFALIVAILLANFPSNARATDKLVIAQSNESLIWAPLYVARKLGYFKEKGIEPDVVIVKSGPDALVAVNTGSAQIAMGFPATPIQALGKGLDIKIFAELSNQFIAQLMLRKDVAMKLNISEKNPVEERAKSLKGLKIALNGIRSANDYLLRRVIADVGLKPDADVTITPIGDGPTILSALDQNRIDGFITTPPANVVATKEHNAIQLIDFAAGDYKPVAGMIYIGWAAQGAWLKKNPELAARAVKAINRALALMREKPDVAKEAARSFFPKTPAADFDASWESQLSSFPANARLVDRDMQITLDFVTTMGANPAGLKSSDIFTNEISDLADKLK